MNITKTESGLKHSLPPMLNSNQAAEVANLSQRTINRMCSTGKLKAVKVGSIWRINRDNLLAFLELD